jgi:hypothetical protein
MPFIAILVAALLLTAAVGAAAALATWNKIIAWAFDVFVPWVTENAPWLTEYVRETFIVLDHIAGEARKKIKELWQALRRELLSQIVEFERDSNGEWVTRITSWVRLHVESTDANRPHTKQVTVTTWVPWDELPNSVRRQWMRTGTTPTVDITRLRDEELELSEGG